MGLGWLSLKKSMLCRLKQEKLLEGLECASVFMQPEKSIAPSHWGPQ
jgi:hypothetical protein